MTKKLLLYVSCQHVYAYNTLFTITEAVYVHIYMATLYLDVSLLHMFTIVLTVYFA